MTIAFASQVSSNSQALVLAQPFIGRYIQTMSKTHLIHVAGRDLPLSVKRSGTAGRMSLRLEPGSQRVVVVLPVGVPESEARRFADRQTGWIAERLAASPDRIAFAPGVVVPLLGLDHEIRHQPQARRGVWAEDGIIHVSGAEDLVGGRVERFLKAEARLLLAHKARRLAEQAGRKVARVSVRDTKSRWGSCSGKGDLSFSWRLVMAPDWIVDYVVAHEVAHLVEMNHSPRFWAVVESLAGDVAGRARDWLKESGPSLHRYGPLPS
jgi:predicted metal-dependent hydrolase